MGVFTGDMGNTLLSRRLRDAVLVFRKEIHEIAFVVDSPGNWLCYRHTLPLQDSGMKTRIRVQA